MKRAKYPDDRPVVLCQVWQWTCPRCKNDYYEEMQIAELDEGDKQMLMIDHNMYAVETGDFVTPPRTVTCPVCDFDFDAIAEFELQDE